MRPAYAWIDRLSGRWIPVFGGLCVSLEGWVSDSSDGKNLARFQVRPDWIPAFAGMTEGLRRGFSSPE